MGFFDNLKNQLETTINELSTIEHALIVEESDNYVYRYQQIEGDSIISIAEEEMSEEYFILFNDAFSAASESRTSLAKFIIECLT